LLLVVAAVTSTRRQRTKNTERRAASIPFTIFVWMQFLTLLVVTIILAFSIFIYLSFSKTRSVQPKSCVLRFSHLFGYL
jgi:hypothetical protein